MRFSLAVLAAAAFAATATASKIFGDDTIINRADDYRDNYEIPEDNLLPDECESWISNCDEYIYKEFGPYGPDHNKNHIGVAECGQGPAYTAMSLSCHAIKVNQQTAELAKLSGYKRWSDSSS
ncbi:hypothetical protein K492DRAFT_239096 [Lichtheimia hyalospora FSU 10163]|nr:hypothetical protein K492DRAFT_239096 [Lichtheimia hyalospora FSU 10163]